MALHSCYFCGVAGRTVRPRSVSDVDVTLCPRCEEKLARLRTASDGEVDVTDATPVSFDAPAEADESAVDPAPTGSATASGSPASSDDPDETADPTPDDVGNDADANAAGESPDDASTTGLRGLGTAERGDRSTYRQALRLLRNREFPMARSDTVSLLSSAYDLDREECEALLDFCVDRGLLAEADGELREP